MAEARALRVMSLWLLNREIMVDLRNQAKYSELVKPAA